MINDKTFKRYVDYGFQISAGLYILIPFVLAYVVSESALHVIPLAAMVVMLAYWTMHASLSAHELTELSSTEYGYDAVKEKYKQYEALVRIFYYVGAVLIILWYPVTIVLQ